MTFYAVSGFVIAEAAMSVYCGRPFAFILNRAVRIALPYWIALTLMLLVTVALGSSTDYAGRLLPDRAFSAENIVANYLYFWPVGMTPFDYRMPHDFLLVFWSLRYEVVFYLAVLVGLVIARGSDNRLAHILVGGALAALAMTLYSRIGLNGLWAGFHTVPWPFFSGGVLAFFALKEGAPAMKACAVAAAAVGFAGVGYSAPQVGAVDTSIQLATLMCLLSAAWFLAGVTRFAFVAADQYFGDLSYSLYLVHIPVQLAVIVTPYRGPLVAFFAIGVSVIAAAAFNALTAPAISAIRDKIRGRALQRPARPADGGGASHRTRKADPLRPETMVPDRRG